MERERFPRRSRRPGAVFLTLAALPACSAEPERSDNVIVVAAPSPIASQSATTVTSAPAVAPSLPGATVTDRPPLSQMKPHKAFIDPPLPPELRDDGGLKPLPPNPRK